ncbi:hypothetical protein [Silanimonas sp.]|uniref:hypothetical protein n=1 Tax=Silanimonas sp. TaxID=1929290 RepID=UPI0022C5654E|nr:hypothetical protein [Silanimonas sp.]MCZ8164288.1 hypothetical protein [Silanimonas sp.]
MSAKAALWAAFVFLPLLVGAALWPGLSGDFLFDDYANLPALGAFGPFDGWQPLLLYLTSGIADPLGRPLAMASFLIDAQGWPAAPGPFLRTNVVIHGLNAVLVALLGARLLRAEAGPLRWAPFVAAALWALHPMQGTTALYIVQRHALLAATFTLLGLLAFIALWRAAPERRLTFAALYLMAGAAAVACKLNGLLLPVLALALLPLLRRDSPPHGGPGRWVVALAAGPAIGLGLLLALQVPGAMAGAEQFRDFSLAGRLLAQPGILVGYLADLITIAPHSGDLMFNPPAVPDGLADPRFWAPAGLLGGALLAALALGHRAPVLASASLFYLGGHLIEAGPVNLELAFAHRNYLPSALLFLPVAVGLARLPVAAALRAAIGIGAVAVVALVLHGEAQLWGQPRLLAEVWAQRSPASERAQVNAATWDLWYEDPARGLARLASWRESMASSTQLALTLLDLECAMGAVSTEVRAAVPQAMGADKRGLEISLSAIDRHDQRYEHCSESAPTSAAMLEAAAANPHWRREATRRDLAFSEAAWHANQGRIPEATAALVSLPAPLPCGPVLRGAALLAQHGGKAEALAWLDDRFPGCEAADAPAGMPRLHRWLRHRLGVDARERDALEAMIRG